VSIISSPEPVAKELEPTGLDGKTGYDCAGGNGLYGKAPGTDIEPIILPDDAELLG
jgi:hypothetical protein